MNEATTGRIVSRRTALAGLGAGGLGVAVAITPRVAAQDAPADLAVHPVVGLWSSVFNPESPPAPRAMIAFHGDGTLTSLNSFGGTGVGAWQASGERSVQMVLTFYNIAQVAGEFVDGTVTVSGVLTVDEAGTTLAEESTVDIRAADGTMVANIPVTGTFDRMTPDAPVPVGTPEATPTS